MSYTEKQNALAQGKGVDEERPVATEFTWTRDREVAQERGVCCPASGREEVVHADSGGGLEHQLARMGQKVPRWDARRPSLWEQNKKTE